MLLQEVYGIHFLWYMTLAKTSQDNEDVIERDNAQCQYCRHPSRIVHHIIYRSHHGTKTKDEQDSMRNRVVLCPKCHNLIHEGKLCAVYFERDKDRPIILWANKVETIRLPIFEVIK